MLIFIFFLVFKQEYDFETGHSSYGHTTVKAPHPIRTAKLSTVGPDQYFGRGLQGNLGCCMSFCFFAASDAQSGEPRQREAPLRRYSIGAVPRLVAPVALVRFQVVADPA